MIHVEDKGALHFSVENLWKPDQQTFAKLKIFDVIKFGQLGIKGWLFSASDGSIKSKAQSNWTQDNLTRTCCDDNKSLAHYSFDGKKWKNVGLDFISYMFEHPRSCTVICHAKVSSASTKPLAYIEHTFDRAKAKFLVPFQSTSFLCSSVAKGRSLDHDPDSVVPSEKVSCTNKETDELCQTYCKELVKVLETRSESKVQRIVLVLVIDGSHDIFSPKDTKKLYLHHVREVTYIPVQEIDEGDGRSSSRAPSQIGKKSVRSVNSKSTLSTVIQPFNGKRRGIKCNGDFCHFIESEEKKVLAALGDGNGVGGHENIHEEVKRARWRHKEGSKGDFRDHHNDDDSLADEDEEENIPPREGPGSSVTLDSLSPRRGELGDMVSDLPVILTEDTALKVPFKAIVRAREEASIKDNSEGSSTMIGEDKHNFAFALGNDKSSGADSKTLADVVWPPTLLHWWSRIGRNVAAQKALRGVTGIVDKKTNPKEMKVSEKNVAEASRAATANLKAGEMTTERSTDDSSPRHWSDSPAMPSDSPTTNRRSGINMIDPLQNVEKGELREHKYGHMIDGHIEEGFDVPYDLGDNAYAGKTHITAGLYSVYYKDVPVCKRCYKIYANLDKRRKKIETNAMVTANMRAQEERLRKEYFEATGVSGVTRSGEPVQITDKQRDRLIEMKLFEQRKSMSRLAQPQIRESETQPSAAGRLANMKSKSRFPYSDSAGHLFTDQSFEKKYGVPAGMLHPKTKGPVKLPSSAVQAVPWKLSDDANRKQYENSTTNKSKVAKSIGKRAYEMTSKNRQEKMLKKYAMQQGIPEGSVDMYGSTTQILPDYTPLMGSGYNPNYVAMNSGKQWEMATGKKLPDGLTVGFNDSSVMSAGPSVGMGVGGQSKGSVGSIKSKLASTVKDPKGNVVVLSSGKAYDNSHLLHPWQRQLNDLKEQFAKVEETVAKDVQRKNLAALKVPTGSGFNGLGHSKSTGNDAGAGVQWKGELPGSADMSVLSPPTSSLKKMKSPAKSPMQKSVSFQDLKEVAEAEDEFDGYIDQHVIDSASTSRATSSVKGGGLYHGYGSTVYSAGSMNISSAGSAGISSAGSMANLDSGGYLGTGNIQSADRSVVNLYSAGSIGNISSAGYVGSVKDMYSAGSAGSMSSGGFASGVSSAMTSARDNYSAGSMNHSPRVKSSVGAKMHRHSMIEEDDDEEEEEEEEGIGWSPFIVGNINS